MWLVACVDRVDGVDEMGGGGVEECRAVSCRGTGTEAARRRGGATAALRSDFSSGASHAAACRPSCVLPICGDEFHP